MKIAFAITAVLIITSLDLAQSQQFVPLNTYVQQENIAQNPAALGYVAIRCSALYAVFTAMLDGETDPAMQQQRASFEEAGMKFQKIALNARMTGSTMPLQEAGRAVGLSLTEIALLYNERIKRVKNLSNNMFTDPLIAGDFNVCKMLGNGL